MEKDTLLQLAPPTFHGRRDEIEKIIDMAAGVRPGVLLIEGPGGMGKSMLIRQAVDVLKLNHPGTHVIGPLDMDDTNYHIPTNVGLEIAHSLGEEHFTRYIEANRKYRGRELQKVDRSSIHIHQALSDRYFVDDFSRLARQQRIVIFADTIETIRGTHVWSYFTRMISSLPNTVFVLAGRRSSPFGLEKPPFSSEKRKFEKMPIIGEGGVQLIQLKGWPKQEAQEFITKTNGGSTLSAIDREKLLYLSRCQPLHLTLALEHLHPLSVLSTSIDTLVKETPLYKSEADKTLPQDESVSPNVDFGDLSNEGKSLVTQFNRELLLHLADTSPLARTMRRIAHLRRRISKEMYTQIIAFTPAIKDAPSWEDIGKQPWVRHRTGGFITWHDIVGELLRQHIWPLRDHLGKKRQRLSRQAINLYDDLIRELQNEIAQLNAKYDARLDKINQQENVGLILEDDFPELIKTSNQLIELRRRLWPIEAERLYYELDADVQLGYRIFIEMYNDANQQGQLIASELLLSEIENYLTAFELGSDAYYEIVRRQIDTAISDNCLAVAAETAEHLPILYSDHKRQCELLIKQGNIFLRMPGRELDGLRAFEQTRVLTEISTDLSTLVGEALSEIGFAYRQLGRWGKAAEMYRQALQATPLSNRSLRAEISIQLAYAQTLVGEYDAANKFIESTLIYLRHHGKRVLFGAGLSVQGEVYRYQKKYAQAHAAYDEAIALFSGLENQGWLGVIQQEKAICLIQEENPARNLTQARYYIEQALYLCREKNTRAYPSALNRSGRICKEEGDYTGAFKAFREGVEVAQAAQNVWFLMANVIEYAELAVQLWHDTDIPEHRKKILEYEELVERYAQVQEYEFADLFGRWHLVKGHTAWYEGKKAKKSGHLDEAKSQWQIALEEYASGFSMIAQGYYGSHGIGALPREGDRLRIHMMALPVDEGKRWCEYFHKNWSSLDDPAILSGIVEEIYGAILQKEEETST